jgi:prepilin-type processing-associated H-X9-DG protein
MSAIPSIKRGMTIVEVLLLVATASLLVAVGVPALTTDDRIKERQLCADRLGTMAKAASLYASLNDDWILGSPNSSGAYLLGNNINIAYGPAVQVWDFMGPLAEFFSPGSRLPPQSGSVMAVAKRFNYIRNSDFFKCPSNSFTAVHFNGPNPGTGPMISYNSARNQLFKHENSSNGNGISIYNNNNSEWSLPVGYQPRVNQVGNPSGKVWIADGGRFTDSTQTPDYDLSVRGGWGGAFADAGPYTMSTNSWDRSAAPGNFAFYVHDGRQFAFRHSDAQPPAGAPADAFKMNLAFHDGHVETQGDLTSANPQQWLPTGSRFNTAEAWPDARAYYAWPQSLLIH